MGAELTTRQQIRKEQWEAAHPPRHPLEVEARRAKWAQRGRCEKWVRIWLGVFGVCLVGLVIVPGVNVVTYAFAIVAFFAFCVSFFPWIWWSAWKLGGALGDNVARAVRPIPHPGEIAGALEQEWGREPTVEEVAAVHQMLNDEHNRALVNSGIGIGALYLFSHNLHG